MADYCIKEYAQLPVSDPKSVKELTSFVEITLQQMQDKFQSVSDQIINKNILLILNQFLQLFYYYP